MAGPQTTGASIGPVNNTAVVERGLTRNPTVADRR
jgi:hypothetical protein